MQIPQNQKLPNLAKKVLQRFQIKLKYNEIQTKCVGRGAVGGAWRNRVKTCYQFDYNGFCYFSSPKFGSTSMKKKQSTFMKI